MENIEQYRIESHITALRIYEKEDKRISLIYPHRYTMNCYEICCIKEGIFDCLEKYDTLENAEKRITELLK